MQEKTIKEQLAEVKGTAPNLLNPILKNKIFAWIVFSITLMLMFIDNFLKIDEWVGAWHIVLYVLLLVPMVYLVWKKELVNTHTKWFLPVLFVLIIDMFYYSNDMVQYVVPIVFYVLVAILYITSMHKNHSLYQTLIPRFELALSGVDYFKTFFANLFVLKGDNELYKRIALALIITVPFLGVFVALLFSADSNFESFLSNMVDFSFDFNMKYIWTVPWTFALYLFLFIYGVSNYKDRIKQNETQKLDMLIVGIFLGMIALLFALFIAVQLPFLFGGSYLPKNTNLAEFARQGFFQLMMVMGLVMLIFLFIMRRFKGEKVATVLLSVLLVETIVMGLVSLKKMYLYQSIKGVTVLRYYVEWFDYFLIAVLALGIFFLIKKLNFSKLLDMVVVLGVFAFTLIVSLNVDGMVASHNIEKFKDNPSALDKRAISYLSIDALPVLQESDIVLNAYQVRDCSQFSEYHLGYCLTFSTYENKNVKKSVRHNELDESVEVVSD
jgi:hypothetical protein